MISGSVWPNALQTLTAAGFQIFPVTVSTLAQAIKDYKASQLQTITQINPVHAGMGRRNRMVVRNDTNMTTPISKQDPMKNEHELQKLKNKLKQSLNNRKL